MDWDDIIHEIEILETRMDYLEKKAEELQTMCADVIRKYEGIPEDLTKRKIEKLEE